MHDLGLVHRDIKPDNILLSNNHTAKLADFGSIHRLQNRNMTVKKEMVSGAGFTTIYAAPEVLAQGHLYVDGSTKPLVAPLPPGRRVDLWSLGCVVLEMATGQHPYHEL